MKGALPNPADEAILRAREGMHALHFQHERGYLWLLLVVAGVILVATGRTLPGLNLLMFTGFAAVLQKWSAQRSQASLTGAMLDLISADASDGQRLRCTVHLFAQYGAFVRSVRIRVVGYEAEDDLYAPEYGKRVEFTGKASGPRFLQPGLAQFSSEIRLPFRTVLSVASEADVRWAVHVTFTLGADLYRWSAHLPLEPAPEGTAALTEIPTA